MTTYSVRWSTKVWSTGGALGGLHIRAITASVISSVLPVALALPGSLAASTEAWLADALLLGVYGAAKEGARD